MFFRAVHNALRAKNRAGPALTGVARRFSTVTHSQKAGRQGGRHHRCRQRHRSRDGQGVRPERRQGRPRRRPGRPGPRSRRRPRHRRRGMLHPPRPWTWPSRATGDSTSSSTTPLGALDLADFDRVMAVNTRGVMAGVKHAPRVMVPRRSGSIICTASIAGVLGMLTPHPYSVSKAAVVGLVRAVAGEVARSGVRVNAISPNYILTPLVMRILEEWYPERSAEEHRLIVERNINEMEGVVLEPEDIARAAL